MKASPFVLMFHPTLRGSVAGRQAVANSILRPTHHGAVQILFEISNRNLTSDAAPERVAQHSLTRKNSSASKNSRPSVELVELLN
jgi:hypothetical protein